MTAPEVTTQAVTLRYRLHGFSRTDLADARTRLAAALADVTSRLKLRCLSDPTVQARQDDHSLIVKLRVGPASPDDAVVIAKAAVLTAAGAGLANLKLGEPCRQRCHEALPFRVA